MHFNHFIQPNQGLTTSDKIQAAMSFFTFCAVIVALFGERFWRWLDRPKIEISFDKNSDRCFRWADVQLCNIQDEGQKANVRKQYFRLRITNKGRFAKRLRVRVDIKDKAGKEVERFEPSTLQWINRKEENDLLNGESEYVNFLSQIINHPDIKNRLTVEIFDTSPRGIAWDRELETYKYTITVFGENIKPVSINATFVPNKDKTIPGNLHINNNEGKVIMIQPPRIRTQNEAKS